MSAEAFAKMSETTYEEFEKVQLEEDYPPPKELLSALKKIVTGSSTSIDAIAKEAATPFLDNIPEDAPEGLPDCSLLWRTLLEAINAFTDKNDQFVDFVIALMRLNNGDNLIKKSPEFDQHMTEFALGSMSP